MQNTRMLFLITTIVVVFIGSNVAARPIISWEPANIEIEQMQGTQSIHTIILKSTEDLQDIKAYVAPKLKPWVSISPANIELITKDSNFELTLTINVAPNATAGNYKGAVLIQQASGGKIQIGIAKFFPIRLVITEKGAYDLPPDPGEPGKETLLGIDSDSDGVRDDIQRYIYFNYPENKTVRMALTQIAIEYQTLFSQAGVPDAAFNIANRMARHGECLFYILDEASLDAHAALKAEILNTKERSIAYINYSDSLGGEIIMGAPVKKWHKSCNFDIDAIGGDQ
jgi:hypothetical protein